MIENNSILRDAVFETIDYSKHTLIGVELLRKDTTQRSCLFAYVKDIKSLEQQLQQAKEGLEFYAEGKHIVSYTKKPKENLNNFQLIGCIGGQYIEYGSKARETLEIINKGINK